MLVPRPALSRLVAAIVLPFLIAIAPAGAVEPPPPPDWPSGSQVPSFEAFWQRQPEADALAQITWHFDSGVSPAAAAALEELDPMAMLNAPEEPSLVTRQAVAFLIAGAVQEKQPGRFGDGLLLQAGGTVETRSGDFAGWLDQNPALTLECWLRPATASLQGAGSEAGDGRIVWTLGGAGGGGRAGGKAVLALAIGGDGVPFLSAGGTVLARGALPVSAEAWSHVAVVLVGGRSPRLRLAVNGHERAELEGTGVALRKAMAGLGERLTFGDSDAARGYAGGLDEVRVSTTRRYFYALDPAGLADSEAARPYLQAPPYFLRRDAWLALPFDGSAAPTAFHGTAVEGVDAVPPSAFVPGVRGQALDLSQLPADAGLAWLGYETIPKETGTLEFWMQPKDWTNFYLGREWTGVDIKGMTLFRIAWADAPPYLHERSLGVRLGVQARLLSGAPDWTRLAPGSWTHVLVTWGAGKPQAVFLNGRAQPLGQVGWHAGSHPHVVKQREDWKARTEGGDDDGTFRLSFMPSATLVDELRAYNYRFTPMEAANAYARWFGDRDSRLQALPPIGAEFEYFAHSWSMEQRLNIRLNCLPVNEVAPASASVRLHPEGAADAVPEAVVPKVELDANGQGLATITRDLPFGRYVAEVETRDAAGKVLATAAILYDRQQPPWWQNTLGKEPTVPAPWTPIARSSGDATGPGLRVWGRDIELAATGLPARITAQDRSLLAAPVAMYLRLATAAPDAPPTLFTATANAPLSADAIALAPADAPAEATWQATSAAGPVRATVEGRLAFDGLTTLAVTLQPTDPAAGATVELAEYWLDLPLTAAEATQFLGNSGGPNFRASYDIRMLPTDQGRLWDSVTSRPRIQRAHEHGSFFPALWVGGDHIGLHVSADNDSGWIVDDERPAQEVLRVGDQVILRLHVIAHPVTLTAPRRFQIYLLPTPTKPLEPGWRGWNRAAPDAPWGKVDNIDTFIGFPLTASATEGGGDISFTLEPQSWEDAAVQNAAIKEKFGAQNPVLFYIDYSWPKLGPSMADWKTDLWAGAGRMTWTREVEDYMVWIINEYIERDLIDGLYIDDVSLGRTYSLASTAYIWEGNKHGRRLGFSSMGFRRFLMRVYRLLAAKGKTPLLLPHMTYCFELPALSMCIATVNGEDRDIHPVTDRDAIDTWRQAELRVMGTAEKWGFGTFWKPTVQVLQTAATVPDYWMHRQSRAMHAWLMQHDFYYLWTYPTARSIEPSLVAFDFTDPAMRFVPYWDMAAIASARIAALPPPPKATAPAKPSPTPPSPDVVGEPAADILVGAWVKADRALIMVSNIRRGDREIQLTLDPAALFGRPVAATAVTWQDVDSSLPAPPGPGNLQDAQGDVALGNGAVSAADLLTGGNAGAADADTLLNQLEAKDPLAVEAERLALQPDGATVRLIVRGHDYRLLEVRVGAPQ